MAFTNERKSIMCFSNKHKNTEKIAWVKTKPKKQPRRTSESVLFDVFQWIVMNNFCFFSFGCDVQWAAWKAEKNQINKEAGICKGGGEEKHIDAEKSDFHSMRNNWKTTPLLLYSHSHSIRKSNRNWAIEKEKYKQNNAGAIGPAQTLKKNGKEKKHQLEIYTNKRMEQNI